MRATLLILLLTLACALSGAGEQFEYDRAAVEAGEVWRLLTSHLAHWSTDQMIWDGLAFAALAAICAARWPKRFAIALGASAMAIPLFVHFFMPHIATYRGLSGIDSALFALAAVLTIADEKRAFAHGGCALFIVLLSIGFGAKIGYEVVTGSTFFVRELAPNVIPLPLAHVVGAAAGVLSSLSWKRVGRGSPIAGRRAALLLRPATCDPRPRS